MMSMLIASLVTVALAKSMILMQYSAEDNLYQVAALNVAETTLTQMKSASPGVLLTLANSNDQTFKVDLGIESIELNLGQENELSVPIVIDADKPKSMTVIVNPTIDSLQNDTVLHLKVAYTFEHPRTGRVRNKFIQSMRSRVNTY